MGKCYLMEFMVRRISMLIISTTKKEGKIIILLKPNLFFNDRISHFPKGHDWFLYERKLIHQRFERECP